MSQREESENEDHHDTVEQKYRQVIASLSEGLLVQFNNDVPGMAGTPELHVETAYSNGAMLTESPDRFDCDWEIRPDDSDRLALYTAGQDDGWVKYERVLTIEVVGYDGE